VLALLEMCLQRRPIAAGQSKKFTFHKASRADCYSRLPVNGH
jgi:hypothetical protein